MWHSQKKKKKEREREEKKILSDFKTRKKKFNSQGKKKSNYLVRVKKKKKDRQPLDFLRAIFKEKQEWSSSIFKKFKERKCKLITKKEETVNVPNNMNKSQEH